MTRFALITAAALATAGIASAQYPGQFPGAGGYGMPYGGSAGFYPPSAFQPNIYNPANQPLSPYLNLLRGGNAATNYFYGVRPGTVGGTGFGYGTPNMAFGGSRAPFFPQLVNAPDPLESLVPGEPSQGSVLPPAGHPVVFNNTLGYFPSPFGYRGGMGGGFRPGLSGAGGGGGAAKPPARR